MKKILKTVISFLPSREKNAKNFNQVNPSNTIKQAKNRFSSHLDDQLHLVADSNFSTKSIMNKAEYKLFKEIQKIISANKLRLFVFPQVNLGEIFHADNTKAFGCINSKRSDLTIVNATGHPIMIIEYQGAGHYLNKDENNKGRTLISDAIKREVCRKAGVIFFEIDKNYGEEDLQKILSFLKKC